MTTFSTASSRRLRSRPMLAAALTVVPLLLSLLPVDARAQAGRRSLPRALPEVERPTAYLVTIGPGDAVWERFGHNLIWIHDPESGTDEGYNYGLFSFEQENFVVRFIRGYMLYWMEGFDIRSQLRLYVAENRTIWIQELALDVTSVRELHAFLEWNERPENRFYRYDYYRDNCSTRVRDALDRVLGGALGRWARARPTPASYRDHTLRQTAGLFWVSVGMHSALGPAADRPLSAWQAMFIPMELQAHLRDFTTPAAAGTPVPLVRAEWTWFEADRAPTPQQTPRWIPGFLLTGLLLTCLVVGLGMAAPRDGGFARLARAALVAFAVTWLTLLGIVGTLYVFAWGFTDHVFTHGTLNLFYANPLLLAVAAAVWPLTAGRPWAMRWAPRLGFAVAVFTLVGVLLEALPVLDQANGEFVALMAPVNLALAWVVWRLGTTVPAAEAD